MEVYLFADVLGEAEPVAVAVEIATDRGDDGIELVGDFGRIVIENYGGKLTVYGWRPQDEEGDPHHTFTLGG